MMNVLLCCLCCCKSLQNVKDCCCHLVCFTNNPCWIVEIVFIVALLIFSIILMHTIENIWSDCHYWTWRKKRGY